MNKRGHREIDVRETPSGAAVRQRKGEVAARSPADSTHIEVGTAKSSPRRRTHGAKSTRTAKHALCVNGTTVSCAVVETPTQHPRGCVHRLAQLCAAGCVNCGVL